MLSVIAAKKRPKDVNILTEKIAADLIEIIPRVMRRIRDEMKRVAKNDLTVGQLRIMGRLYYEDQYSISSLADQHGVSVAAMSKMISHLESKEIVERTFIRSDRRQVKVGLTLKGKTNFLAIRKLVRSRIAEDIKVLGQEEKEATYAFLKAMNRLYRF